MHEMVPIVLFTTMFGMIFGIYYIRSKENMAMLEKGLNPRIKDDRAQPFIYLKYGCLLLGAGLGLLAAYFIDGNVNHKAITPGGEVYDKDNPAIYFALIAIGGGLGLVVSFLIEKKYWRDKKKED